MENKRVRFFLEAYINSYSQLFFSDNKIFAFLILLSTFIDPTTGLSGALGIIISILFSYWIGLDRNSIKFGSYSFNGLMVGLALGITYQWNIQFAISLVCASILTVLIYVLLQNISFKYKVPVMSLPFLLSLWIVMLSFRMFNRIELENETSSALQSSWFGMNINFLTSLSEKLNDLFPSFFVVYFKSISAIFFQYNFLAGFLAAIGLLIYSRIAFTLSFIGFSIGYLFYFYMAGTFTPLLYSYIGFNFILTAITLGGYFVIPSKRSYALVIIATLVIAILISTFSVLLYSFQLPLFSLPFNIAIILFMMLLNSRVKINGLSIVINQLFSPEKNLYYFHNRIERYKNETYIHMHPPFFGEWNISQGFNGKFTHKEDWRYAWDFVVTDEMKHTFKLPGTEVTDFFCYNLPVLAPASGTIWNVIDGINDNEIGDVDIYNNWGNTIIIKHTDFLFSKLSHLKKGSITKKIGDYVQRGEFIATCGSSGRSPEPHIHFQLQSTPYVGSKTMLYPISYYMTKNENKNVFHSFEYPEENQIISRVETTQLLTEGFNFIPGVTMKFEYQKNNSQKEISNWEVFTDAANKSYLFCSETKSFAYFINNGTIQYFTDFIGDHSSLLFHFYVAANKILLGYYQDAIVTDTLPLTDFFNGFNRTIQDFVAPFYMYLKTEYHSDFLSIDDTVNPKEIKIHSSAKVKSGDSVLKEINYELFISNHKISEFKIISNKETITATCIA